MGFVKHLVLAVVLRWAPLLSKKRRRRIEWGGGYGVADYTFGRQNTGPKLPRARED